MNSSQFIKPVYSLLFFMILELVILSGLFFYYDKEKQDYENELIDRLQTVINAVVNIYSLVSKTIFEEVINKPDIIDLFKYAHSTTTEEQAIIRKKIHEKLKPTHERLEKKNLQQLHFHLPDNTSFLRMHKPNYFGDNLSELRYSVKLTNELKRPVQGFEEGKLISAYRYVFPLFDDTTHIGSVETTMAFNGINKEITKLYPQEYQLIVKKDIIVGKIFSNEQSNYIPCIISNDYMCEGEKLNSSAPPSNTVKELDAMLMNKLNQNLESNQPFVSTTRLKNINYVLSFYPVKNLKNQSVAYIIGYHENNHFAELEHDMYLKMLVFSLLNITGFLFIYNIQRHQKLMQQKNNMLIKADQEKNEFLGIVVHDLKNPLSGIQMLSEEIKSNFNHFSKQEIIEFASLISDSSKRMFGLISNLLDVNAIESGKFALEFEQVELLPIVNNIISIYQTPAQKKNLTFQINTPSNLQPIYADKIAVIQILDNIISNAVKYSSFEKVISIDIDTKQNTVSCSIKNEGQCLTDSDLQKLFNKFSRLSTKPTNGEHSTGLGLFIVKKLADSIHATVTCENKQNQGVIFTIDFPLTNPAS